MVFSLLHILADSQWGGDSVVNKKKTSRFFRKKTCFFLFCLKAKKRCFFVFIAQFKGKVKFKVYFKCTVKIKKKALYKMIRY